MKDMISMLTNKVMVLFMVFIIGMAYINSVQYQKQEIMVQDEKIVALNK